MKLLNQGQVIPFTFSGDFFMLREEKKKKNERWDWQAIESTQNKYPRSSLDFMTPALNLSSLSHTALPQLPVI